MVANRWCAAANEAAYLPSLWRNTTAASLRLTSWKKSFMMCVGGHCETIRRGHWWHRFILPTCDPNLPYHWNRNNGWKHELSIQIYHSLGILLITRTKLRACSLSTAQSAPINHLHHSRHTHKPRVVHITDIAHPAGSCSAAVSNPERPCHPIDGSSSFPSALALTAVIVN